MQIASTRISSQVLGSGLLGALEAANGIPVAAIFAFARDSRRFIVAGATKNNPHRRGQARRRTPHQSTRSPKSRPSGTCCYDHSSVVGKPGKIALGLSVPAHP